MSPQPVLTMEQFVEHLRRELKADDDIFDSGAVAVRMSRTLAAEFVEGFDLVERLTRIEAQQEAADKTVPAIGAEDEEPVS